MITNLDVTRLLRPFSIWITLNRPASAAEDAGRSEAISEIPMCIVLRCKHTLRITPVDSHHSTSHKDIHGSVTYSNYLKSLSNEICDIDAWKHNNNCFSGATERQNHDIICTHIDWLVSNGNSKQKGQFLPTVGERNWLRRLRMTNEIQWIIPDVAPKNVTHFTEINPVTQTQQPTT